MSDSDYVLVAKFFGIVVTVVVFLVVLRDLFCRTKRSIRRGYWAIRFRLIFGLWPGKEDPLMMKIHQLAVDKTLQQLAVPYGELCAAEEGLGREYRHNEIATRDPWEDSTNARTIKKKLGRAKKRYLTACTAAREHSFYVRDTHRDYLPKEEMGR